MKESSLYNYIKQAHPEINLPESPEDLIEQGSVVEFDEHRGIVLAVDPGTTICTVITEDETYSITKDYLELVPADKIDIWSALTRYTENQQHNGTPTICDITTGETFTSKQHCIDALGLSEASVRRMLKGQVDSVRGHKVRYI